MLERGREYATFRLVIIKGKVYVEMYREAYQTRDFFTIWGILQLLKLYPGKVPDLELMFWCGDIPQIMKADYQRPNSTLLPPPLFEYCGHPESVDIVFPDWTFWGWVETNVKPWTSTMEDIKKGNKRTMWKERIPYAYWKGNPDVTLTRKYLMKCNSSRDKYDWNARLYSLAQTIGREGSKYVEEQLKMKYVYDYMFHLLNEYAKLLNFKPRIPKGAIKISSQKLAGSQDGLLKKFMLESMVNSSSETLACRMPPPFKPLALEAFLLNKEMIKKQVEMWETEFWENLNQLEH
ncbi:O-glucosyltransferase rumi-like [Melia azedarach]|uniref:O-glucosyltransferase rumi-like n=1 Tax=Melia azedarach TaxID=155640 RepID=A0ACC1YT13_MELAZ|nr:O-glucosyltransferase rumi-like [Melia azedarach]